jgi:uncharacterized repeat protein (TIGR01451 family)
MRKILTGLIGLSLMGMALAATPANTNISNQASATYIDSLNQNREIFSNEVITVVQQVYSFTITPDGAAETTPGQTRIALPGAQIYFAYTVTNTGNGSDTINLTTAQGSSDNFDLGSVTIYRDDNCDGTVDSGEPVISSLTLARSGVTPGDSACVIVAGTIPASATNGQIGNLNLLGSGGGSSNDNNNWARATATTQAALDISKSATPSGAVAPGSTIAYSITGQNRGGSAANGLSVSGLGGSGILISDPLPVGLSVSALPTGSAGAGTVQMVKSTNEGVSWSNLVAGDLPLTGVDADADNIRDVWIGMYISGTGAFFPVNASYSFSFNATVPAAASFGTSYANTATAQFNNGSNQSVNSNSTTNTVAASYSVAVGPSGAPTASGPADLQSQGPVYSGQTVSFTNTLRNLGNTNDSFNLSVSGQPSGWTCGVYNGATPISSAVGPFAPGVDFSFQVDCDIPASYTSGTAIDLTVTATSVGNSAQSDTTTDRITSVVSGIGVDLAAHGNTSTPATPADDDPAAQSANPGAFVNFPIDVRNNGQSTDSYNLTSVIPASWTNTFYPDSNCDGSMDSPQPLPVTNTGLVAANGVVCFIAQVGVLGTAAPGSYAVSFSATSTTLSTITDTISTSVSVNQTTTFDFDPNRSGTTTTPGTIVYNHNLINGGNAPTRVTIPASTSAYGWTYQYSLDGTTWVADFTGSNFIAIAAGATQAFYVRVQVPGGEPINRQEAMTITASAVYPGPDLDFSTTADNGSASDFVIDTTTVSSGDLDLSKSAISYVGNAETTTRSASAAIAYPGDRIVYTVTARNLGTANLGRVVIQDPLPGYTDFISVSASISGFAGGATVVYSTDGNTWSVTAPLALAAGQRIYVAVNTAGTAGGAGSIDSTDVMAPGARIDITFKVLVQ